MSDRTRINGRHTSTADVRQLSGMTSRDTPHQPPAGRITPIATGDCLQPEVLSTTGVLGYHDNDPVKLLQPGSRRVAERAPEMAPHERFFGDDETLLSGRLPDGLQGNVSVMERY